VGIQKIDSKLNYLGQPGNQNLLWAQLWPQVALPLYCFLHTDADVSLQTGRDTWSVLYYSNPIGFIKYSHK